MDHPALAPVDPPRFSGYALSTRRGTQGVTHEQLQSALDRFVADTGFRFDQRQVLLDLRSTSAAAFGEAGRHLRAKAAFYPHSRRLVLVAANLESEEDAYATFRHELLVHYGLNLLPAAEKRELLELVGATERDPRFARLWARINTTESYKNLEPLMRAEELLAFVAEDRHGALAQHWDRIVTIINRGLQKIGFLPQGFNSPRELHALIDSITERVRSGAPQLIFPESDIAQFRDDGHPDFLEPMER